MMKLWTECFASGAVYGCSYHSGTISDYGGGDLYIDDSNPRLGQRVIDTDLENGFYYLNKDTGVYASDMIDVLTEDARDKHLKDLEIFATGFVKNAEVNAFWSKIR